MFCMQSLNLQDLRVLSIHISILQTFIRPLTTDERLSDVMYTILVFIALNFMQEK